MTARGIDSVRSMVKHEEKLRRANQNESSCGLRLTGNSKITEKKNMLDLLHSLVDIVTHR